MAFVIPDGAYVSPESIAEAARVELSTYKRPKAVVLIDVLPTTAVGQGRQEGAERQLAFRST